MMKSSSKSFHGKKMEMTLQSYSLSNIQQGILSHSLISQTPGMYITQMRFIISHLVHLTLLQKACDHLLVRHEILRSYISVNNMTNPRLIITENVTCPIEFFDLSTFKKEHQRKKLSKLIQHDGQIAFDVNRAPLIRFKLFKLAEDNYEFICTQHHAILAGDASIRVGEEIFVIYDALLADKQPNLPVAKSYQAYIDYLNANSVTNLDYWRNLLTQFTQPTQISLPTPNNYNLQNSSQKKMHGKFTKRQLQQLKKFSHAHQCTLYTLILGAWGFLLARYAAVADVVFGNVRALPSKITNNMLGVFINTLPIRLKFEPNQTIKDFLLTIREQQAAQSLLINSSLQVIQEISELPKGTSLFNSIVDYKAQSPAEHFKKLGGQWLKRKLVTDSKSHYALALEIYGEAETLRYHINYETHQFSSDQIKQLVKHFKIILLNLINVKNICLKDIEILSKHEIRQQLIQWNNTAVPYSYSITLPQRISKISKKMPNAIAVNFYGSCITYKELEDKANRLAHYLISKNTTKIIAVCMQSSIETIISLLAVVKSGAAYVPIDPALPTERIEYLLQDSNAKIVITDGNLNLQTHSKFPSIEFLNYLTMLDKHFPTSPPRINYDPQHIVYVIYTSGSTGKPKGVMIKHQSIINLIDWHKKYYRINQKAFISQLASLSFDAASWSIWSCLGNGGCLHLISPTIRHNPLALLHWHQEQKITHSFMPTPMAEEMVKLPWPKTSSLRYLLTGGDVLHEFNKQLPFKVINHYGPTEATVLATVSEYKVGEGKPTIGKPIANTKIYIFDENLNLLPVGSVGEIYIGGTGLAAGYWQQIELTQEKFITNPFNSREKLYKTGDLARWLTGGNIEYIGRNDDQVKIRGYRVELNEIESKLMEYPAIKQCVVVAKQRRNENKMLVAYIVTDNSNIDMANMRLFLRSKLPDYMIPTFIIPLTALQLTSSGKIDRSNLPDPLNIITKNQVTYRKPRTIIEKLLLTIWADVLSIDIDSLNVNANFFELGGDSIVSFKIIHRAAQNGITIKPQHLFKYPTIAELGHIISRNNEKLPVRNNITTVKKLTLQNIAKHYPIEIPLTPIQTWFFDKSKTYKGHFNQYCILQLNADIKINLLSKALLHIINQHDALRVYFNYNKSRKVWRQYIHGRLNHLRIKKVISEEHKEYLNKYLQINFNLAKPPLLKAIYFQASTGKRELLLVAHHLIIDGVSWRILIEDLKTIYQQLIDKQSISIYQTDSFEQSTTKSSHKIKNTQLKKFSNKWSDYIDVVKYSELLSNIAFDYKCSLYAVKKLNNAGHQQVFKTYCSNKSTKIVLTELYKFYQAHVDDILLTALTLSLAPAGQSLAILQETHGRDVLSKNIDLTRTMGWFTNLQPIILDLPHTSNIKLAVNAIKHQLAQQKFSQTSINILANYEFLLVFNYLGQFDHGNSEIDLFNLRQQGMGLSASADMPRLAIIEINCFCQSGKLIFLWSYNKLFHKVSTIKHLAEIFHKNVDRIIEHWSEHKNLHTKFPLLPITWEEFNLALKTIRYAVSVQQNPAEALAAIYPLSSLQKGFIFHKLASPASQHYYVQIIANLKGFLDKKLFKQAWNMIVKGHAILRTGFIYEKISQPVQFILKDVSISWQEYDWSDYTNQEDKLLELQAANRQTRFNLSVPPLFNCILIQLAKDKFQFIFFHHHILLDGWSLFILLKDFFTCYDMLLRRKSYHLTILATYQSYIHWLQNCDQFRAKKYWGKLLYGFVSPTQLGIEALNKQSIIEQRNQESLLVDKELTEKINHFTQQYHLTTNTLIQGVWGFLLSRYSREDDVVFGMTVSGRPSELPYAESIVGLTINTVPVRVQFGEQHTVIMYLKQLQQQCANSVEYSYSSLTDIKHWSNVAKRDNLFDTVIIFENYPFEQIFSESIQLTSLQVNETTHYKIALMVLTQPRLELKLDYSVCCFTRQSIKNLLTHFIYILKSFIKYPNVLCQELSITKPHIYNQIVRQWNNTDYDFSHNKTILALLFEQVRRNPAAIALVFLEQQITYSQLYAKVIQRSSAFAMQGIEFGSLVGIYLNRTSEYIVSLLALLHLGATYLPIDTDNPVERTKYIIHDAKLNFVITQQEYCQLFPETISMINLNELNDASEAENRIGKDSIHYLEQPAYVLYTSGSTGNPKGVVIQQKALINFLFAMKKLLNVTAVDTFLALTPFTFDIAGLEIYLPLILGAQIVLAPDNVRFNPSAIQQLLNNHKITVMQATPITWQLLINNDWQPAKALMILCGGEQFPAKLAQQLLIFSNKIWNVYGPTETTIWTTAQAISKIDDVNLIGKPIANTKAYVLDQKGNLLPPNIAGELAIGGQGLAWGYLHNEALTKEKFVFNNALKQYIYKTGDLTKWDYEGNLIYLGRIDTQMKIHGYRIDVAEIEHCLNMHPAVKCCAVIAAGDFLTKHLAAYIVSDDIQLRENKLRHYLAECLPFYMIPTVITFLHNLPTTSNGKINKKKLSTLGLHNTVEEYQAPKTDTEKCIVKIWTQVLNYNQSISRTDNFFDLGGDSISAINVITKIHQHFNKKVTLRSILEYTTLTEIADYLDSLPIQTEITITDTTKFQNSPLIPLKKFGKQEPLFFIHPIGGTVFCYWQLVNNLSVDRAIYAIQDPGIEAENFLFSSFEEMATFYVNIIKQQQPSGPYHLIGASFGGNMAVEIARQLTQLGDEVKLIAVLDAWAIYPARVNNDVVWFKQNLKRQHQKFNQLNHINQEASDFLLNLNWHRQQLLAGYIMPKWDFNLSLFKSEILSEVLIPIAAAFNHWDNYTIRSIMLYTTPGDHETILQTPNVQILAQQLLAVLK